MTMLRVRALGPNNFYKDMVAIDWTERNDVKNGSLATVTASNGKSCILAVRGCEPENKGTIGLDVLSCQKMDLIVGQKYNFTFNSASMGDHLKWALHSADPAARIATWIAIVSVAVSLVGLVISLISFIH
jgi:hypothetical protein